MGATDEVGREIQDDARSFCGHLAETTRTPPAVADSRPDVTTGTSAKDVGDSTSSAMDLAVISGGAPERSKTYRPVGG